MIARIEADWPAPPGVHAFSTTRQGGVSSGAWSSLNLGDRTGDDAAAVRENRRLFCAELPGEPGWLRQVHGHRVLRREAMGGDPPEADASWCQAQGLPCTVLTADCLPVLFCDQAGTRVAAAHAGWRGLAAGILQATVRAMTDDPAEIMAWLGPGISRRAYQVGPEFRERFLAIDARLEVAFEQSGGAWHADLYAIARQMLAGAGVNRVFGGDRCTYTEHETFYSFRRDGDCGRMATTIWLA